MSRSMNRVWLLLLCLVAGEAFALGLGDIRLDSALNQPLRADITLIAASPEELQNLTIELASTETFERYGIDRPFFLSRLNFRIIRSGRADGNVIRVTSQDPVTEPFVTFLVEANWAQGRLLREYTLLLDPPTFAPPPSVAQQQPVAPPVRTAPADSGTIQRPAPAPAASQPAPAAPRPVPQSPAPTAAQSAPVSSPPASFDSTPGGDYAVSRGDTLWGIANRFRSDDRLTINQVMVAIFEANPDAFSGNINALSAGSSLRIPSADEVFRINRGDALAEVQRQNTSWSGVAPAPAPTPAQPSLTLVPPDEDTLTPDDGLTGGVDVDATEVIDTTPTLTIEEIRVQEIEELIADQQDGLVNISDNELAALRRELAELRGEEIPDDLLIDDELMTDDDDDVFADDEEPAVVDDEVTEPEVTEPAPRVTAPQESLVDRILGFLTSTTGMLIGGALVIVTALLVWFARRGSGDDDDVDATGLWETLDADTGGNETSQSTERLRAMAREEDTSIVVVEQARSGDGASTSTLEVPPMEATLPGDSDALASTDTNKILEDTFSSDTAINLDQSDPIAEADFHMAYGLYDQAADLINGALAADPDRQDLMAKLCEIYFVWGNRDAFVDAAQRLQTSLSGAEDPEWDKIVIMGQQIAGDHALFADASLAGATKAVDMAFDSDSNEPGALDMDLAAASPGDAADMIDLGAETQSSPAQGDASSIDFVFDDENEATVALSDTAEADPFAAAFEGGTSEMPTVEVPLEETAESPTIEAAAADITAESPTIEQQLGGLEATTTGEIPAIDDATIEVAGQVDPRASDATAEIDLDDLGLDLDAMQGSLSEDFGEPGVLSDLDDTAESLSLNMDDLDATGENPAIADLDITGTNEALDPSMTGLHGAMDLDATGELPNLGSTGSSRALPDEPVQDDADDLGIDATLLDATGQTQILPEDFAVETGTGRNIERALADDEATMLAKVPDATGQIADDAETMLASLDDDETAVVGDFDFAKTEALPKEAFDGDLTGDATGELPALAPGSTDMDLDLDDLTAALKISGAGDTVNQVRDDATVEQPRPNAAFDAEETAAIAPEEMSNDLHDARTMTEVGTKLDLARAYVDMGDPSGARSILEEVLDEGDESQQQQARQLLESLPS